MGNVQRYSEGVYQSFAACGMRHVGGQRRNGVNDGVKKLVQIIAFQEWLHRRDTYDRYQAERAVVKQAVKVAKIIVDWQRGE